MAKKKTPLATRLLLMLAALAVGIGVGLMFARNAPSGSGTQAPTEEPEETQEPAAQMVETDAATVEYRDTQDVAGNAVITFALTSKLDVPVTVVPENVVVNGQYDVTALGGTTAPIQPGHTGAVSLTFGVDVQTELSGVDELETVSADLVLMGEGFDRLAVVPVTAAL
jgi:hypothetical protein